MSEYPSRSSDSSKWIVIAVVGCGGVAVLACIAAAILIFVLPVAGLALLGPPIDQEFNTRLINDIGVSAHCQEATGLTQAECDAWVSDLRESYSQEYAACEAEEAGNSTAIYECLVDQGLEPD